jgi:hypothetical protein
MNFERRLELLYGKICSDDFLKSRGLGNEVPFWIFDYPAEKELLMRDFIPRLKESLEQDSISVLDVDLYELCLQVLSDHPSIEKIIEYEEKKGSMNLLKKLKPIMKPMVLIERMKDMISDDVDVIFLTGVGKSWPLIRSHTLLNNLQPVLNDSPVVEFFPGLFDDYGLSLFNRLDADNYYRAFKLIDEKLEHGHSGS